MSASHPNSSNSQPTARRFTVAVSDSYATYVDRWAVIVGISKYKHNQLNLKYADRDADALYNLLLSPAGGRFAQDHIIKLTNEAATTSSITRALRSFLKKPDREDLVLIYFACHGSPDLDRPDNIYLITHDTDPNDISGTALPMREIDLSLRENLLAEKVILLADTCHSAAIAGSIGRRSVGSKTQLVNRYLQEVSVARGGIALLTSAEANEVSFEDARWDGGHGVFTHYLLQGMQGAADTNNNGFVTVGELFEYVRDNVKQATDHKQHPCIGANPFDRNLPLAITFPSAIAQLPAQNSPQPSLSLANQSTLNQTRGQSSQTNSKLVLILSSITALMFLLVVVAVFKLPQGSQPNPSVITTQSSLAKAKEIAQTGDLGQAIVVAKTAPESSESQQLIQQWNAQWQRQQTFFQQLKNAYDAQRWQEVIDIAYDSSKLPRNSYWDARVNEMALTAKKNLSSTQVKPQPKEEPAPVVSPKSSQTSESSEDVAENERAGFQAILDGNLSSARAYFGAAYKRSPQYHNVDEIYNTLLTEAAIQKYNNSSVAAKQKILKGIFQTIVDQYSWGAPEDALNQMKTKLKG
jgi:hypothetical protein